MQGSAETTGYVWFISFNATVQAMVIRHDLLFLSLCEQASPVQVVHSALPPKQDKQNKKHFYEQRQF